jgi:hypothetical protein
METNVVQIMGYRSIQYIILKQFQKNWQQLACSRDYGRPEYIASIHCCHQMPRLTELCRYASLINYARSSSQHSHNGCRNGCRKLTSAQVCCTAGLRCWNMHTVTSAVGTASAAGNYKNSAGIDYSVGSTETSEAGTGLVERSAWHSRPSG